MNTITLINGSDQFIFNNIGRATGFEYPSTHLSIEDLAGFKSAAYITSKAGRRRLSWESIVNDLDTNIPLLQLALRQGTLKTIQFDACNSLSLEGYVEIDSILMPYMDLVRRRCHIEAVAPDWRFYSQSTNSDSIAGGSGEQTDNFTNAGTEVTEPTFRIDAAGTEFVIANNLTGDTMTITYNLTAGHYILINVADRTIKLDNSTSIYSALTAGDFWRLAPGTQEIGFTATGYDANTLLTINWKDAYGGI